MKRRFFLSSVFALASCGPQLEFAAPTSDRFLQVRKSKRVLEIIEKGRVVKSYPIQLGFNPIGHKEYQGDGRTPEGAYLINRRNSRSAFYKSLGISYPNAKDRAHARKQGKSAGGDIFIHGQENGRSKTVDYDWTRGCIAVSNADMDELWSDIEIGTKIVIHP